MMRIGTTLFGVILLALAVAGGQASAAGKGKGKGPRASLAAATVCYIDGSDFNVTIRLTDKTSGSGFPVVTVWNVQGLAKTARGNWGNQSMFDAVSGGPEVGLSDIELTLDLCMLPVGAKAVNAAASITYEHNDTGEARTIDNMCSDDPSTDEVEPAGIKLTDEILAGIICP